MAAQILPTACANDHVAHIVDIVVGEVMAARKIGATCKMLKLVLEYDCWTSPAALGVGPDTRPISLLLQYVLVSAPRGDRCGPRRPDL